MSPDIHPWKHGVWRNGDLVETGIWQYHWPSDKFMIRLDSCDPVTGNERRFVVSRDKPEWGQWKLEK